MGAIIIYPEVYHAYDKYISFLKEKETRILSDKPILFNPLHLTLFYPDYFSRATFIYRVVVCCNAPSRIVLFEHSSKTIGQNHFEKNYKGEPGVAGDTLRGKVSTELLKKNGFFDGRYNINVYNPGRELAEEKIPKTYNGVHVLTNEDIKIVLSSMFSYRELKELVRKIGAL